MKFAFITRHAPTQAQIDLAADQDIELDVVGDRDAFTFDANEFKNYDGVIVVHPVSALKAAAVGLVVGVFENENRAPEGERPQFVAKALYTYAPRKPCKPWDCDHSGN